MTLSLEASAAVWSPSATTEQDAPLLLLMHGYGSHEHDLVGLGWNRRV